MSNKRLLYWPIRDMDISSVGIRAVMTLLALLLAPLIYGVGLVAPLTPSEGTPSLVYLLSFWLLPMGLLALIWYWDRSLAGRISSVIVLAIVFGSYLVISRPMWLN